MHGAVLRGFFQGSVSTQELARDLDEAWQVVGPQSRHFIWSDIDASFEITSEHLVRLCEAVLTGGLEPWKLEVAAACLFASDHFTWNGDTVEGDRIASTINDWVTPEINYVLSKRTAEKFRHRLITGEDPFHEERSGIFPTAYLTSACSRRAESGATLCSATACLERAVERRFVLGST